MTKLEELKKAMLDADAAWCALLPHEDGYHEAGKAWWDAHDAHKAELLKEDR